MRVVHANFKSFGINCEEQVGFASQGTGPGYIENRTAGCLYAGQLMLIGTSR